MNIEIDDALVREFVRANDDYHRASAQPEQAARGGEAIILGAAVPLPATPSQAFDACPGIGILREFEADVGEWRWGVAEAFQCMACDRLSILLAELGCGRGEGDGHVAGVEPGHLAEVWAMATNKTRWVPAGRRAAR